MTDVFKRVLACLVLVALFVSLISCKKDRSTEETHTEAVSEKQDETLDIYVQEAQNSTPIELPIIP